jgi:hypothetical protein
METPAKQAPTSCSDLVMRIRKLRWVGLEEKAEQLEKELEQCAVTDRVVPLDSPSTLPSAQFTADDKCTLDHCPHFLERSRAARVSGQSRRDPPRLQCGQSSCKSSLSSLRDPNRFPC